MFIIRYTNSVESEVPGNAPSRVQLAYVGNKVKMPCSYPSGFTEWTKNDEFFTYKKYGLKGMKIDSVTEDDNGTYKCIAMRVIGLKLLHVVHLFVGGW